MSKGIQILTGFLNSGATATASSTATGYDVANAVTLDRTAKWKASGSSAEEIILDCLAPITPTGIGLANGNFSKWGTTVLSYASAGTGGPWTALPALGSLPSVDDLQDYVSALSGAPARQYWKLNFGTASANPYLGVFYLGTLTEIVNPKFGGYKYRPVENAEVGTGSGAGEIAEDYGRTVMEFGFDWATLSQAEVDAIVTPLAALAGSNRQWFYVPRDDTGSGAAGRAYFMGKPRPLPEPVESFTGRFALSFTAREQV